MRIWLDLANSPHPLLFATIARRLEDHGHEIVTTARDNAQTAELARQRWPDVEVIGAASPPGWATKLGVITRRALDLRRWAAARHLDLAVSHNSYAQIVAARNLRIPVATAMDYEHQPANHLAFRLAARVLVPEALDPSALRRQGATASKLVRFPGLKEELYIGDFEPDPGVLDALGVGTIAAKLVIVRTPPTGALYHRTRNPLFDDLLRVICSQDDVLCVVLPRTAEQSAAIAALKLDNCVVPPLAVDARSLIYRADVMVGAGGTMTREAALIGIPTWSAYAGRAPAVDLRLEAQGRIRRLVDPAQLAELRPRQHAPPGAVQLRERGERSLELVVEALLQTPLSRRGVASRVSNDS